AGAEYMAKLARNAGFQQATVLNTDGKPGVFATLDAGAKKTVGLYFMYDVKQFDPAEWTSPPLEARIVDKPGIGKAIVGRGAVNQKGPEAAFLAALHAIRGAGKTMPVNLVMVAEGEEEIGSPHIGQLVHRPDVAADREHRRPRRRLHRAGRQDHPAAPRGREDRHAPRAGHEVRGRRGGAQGASGEARLRRRRGERDRRLRPDRHRGERAADPGA